MDPAAISELPPSVNGSIVVYGVSLFGLLLLTSISLAMIVHTIRDAGFLRVGLHTPLAHFRIGTVLMFLTILLGAGGDLFVLLTWGEISPRALGLLNQFDRVLDGLAMFPVLVAAVMFVRGEPEMKLHLIRPPLPLRLYVEWPMIRRQLHIGIVVAILAAGVAFGKALS